MKLYDKRLRRLEAQACEEGTCPGCGYPFEKDETRRMKVVFGGEPEASTAPVKPPQKPPCPTCGRVDGEDLVEIEYHLRFDNEG